MIAMALVVFQLHENLEDESKRGSRYGENAPAPVTAFGFHGQRMFYTARKIRKSNLVMATLAWCVNSVACSVTGIILLPPALG
jgi:hypothetical protein